MQQIISFLSPTLWKFADGKGQRSAKVPSRSADVTSATFLSTEVIHPPQLWGQDSLLLVESRNPATHFHVDSLTSLADSFVPHAKQVWSAGLDR